METFSEESLLLIKHWDTVQDILDAEKRLRGEFQSVLVSLEPELAKNDWWSDGWAFVKQGVYISNEAWRSGDDYVIWIGVEGFTAERLFGIESPPLLYVWVSGRRHDLVRILTGQIGRSESEVLGEIDHSLSSGYVVRKPVQKCLSEQIGDFDQIIRRPILDFLVHYAKVLRSFDRAIRDHLGTS